MWLVNKSAENKENFTTPEMGSLSLTMVWDGYILGGNFLLDGTSGKYFIKHFAALVNKDPPISICKRWLSEYILFWKF